MKKDTYVILPDGEYLIKSLKRLNISMDKYKTSEMGKALKKVFRGEMEIPDAVRVATEEIGRVFSSSKDKNSFDTGFYGDEIGTCPLCGKTVVRGKYSYGCQGWKEGCKFRISGVICKRVISIANARLLLSGGKTSKIQGFISKNGKSFDAALRLEGDKAVFDFS